MLDFGAKHIFPHYCLDCRAAVSADAMSASRHCSKCNSTRVIPYGTVSSSAQVMEHKQRLREALLSNGKVDPSLYGERVIAACTGGGERVYQIFASKAYICPACGDHSMGFEDVGCFD